MDIIEYDYLKEKVVQIDHLLNEVKCDLKNVIEKDLIQLKKKILEVSISFNGHLEREGVVTDTILTNLKGYITEGQEFRKSVSVSMSELAKETERNIAFRDTINKHVSQYEEMQKEIIRNTQQRVVISKVSTFFSTILGGTLVFVGGRFILEKIKSVLGID